MSVELVHLASLYHDDVMDEAVKRRNVVSVNGRWGNLLAVVVGDFLLARSAEIAASLGTEIAATIATTLARLCQGQIAEVRSVYRIDRSVEDYLAAIADKTGALMGTACRVGALTADLDRRDTEALTAFGESLGYVFQIRDDILDIVATEEESGKPPARTSPRGSTRCRCSAPSSTGVSGRSCVASWAAPSATRRSSSPGRSSPSPTGSPSPRTSPAGTRSRRGRSRAASATASSRGRSRGLGMRLVDDLDRSMRALAS